MMNTARNLAILAALLGTVACSPAEEQPVQESANDDDSALTALDSTRPVGVNWTRTASSAASTVLLNSKGKPINGKVVSDDGAKIEIQFTLKDGTKGVQTLRYDQLAPRTVYELKSQKVEASDGAAQLELATGATELGLYDAARQHYIAAALADDSLAQQSEDGLTALKDVAATNMVESARKALKANQLDRAEKLLSNAITQFPNSEAVAGADDVLTELSTKLVAEKKKAAEVADAALAKRLAPVNDLYSKGLESMEKGISGSRTPSQAIKAFKAASSDFQNARKKLAAVTKDASGDEQVVAAVNTMSGHVNQELVRNQLQMANSYMQRGSYKDARDAVGLATEVDPDNTDARSLLTLIAEAEEYADWDRWWYANKRGDRMGRGTRARGGAGGPR